MSKSMIFDGRGFADKIARRLRDEVIKLGRKPKLVTIVDPDNEAGMKYSQLKANKANALGVEFEQIEQIEQSKLIELMIKKLNADEGVDGIMIQMPFPNSKFLINLIEPNKDVDGLCEDSPFKPAVVRAVLAVLCTLYSVLSKKIIVVGSKGFVGSHLVKELNCGGLDIGDDLDQLKNADIIISATGQPGLIKPEMVKDGFMAIDLGYPKAEFTPAALVKASFYTPVPGGVGPVTVVMLFANLLESCK